MEKILTYVYRNTLGDTTANGLTSQYDRLYLYYGDLNDDEINELPDDSLIYIERTFWGKPANHAVPVQIYRSKKHAMFGGNFVHSSDSRFPDNAPVYVHDRVEN